MSNTKTTLRFRNKGPAVKELQMLLNAQSCTSPKLTADGDFGSKTLAAVKVFQKISKLTQDGIVGPKTWTALGLKANDDLYKYPPGPQEALADIAVPYIGATEARGNKMGSDARMKEIFEADHLSVNGATDGYPWCCAFVSMCVQKFLKQSPFHGQVKAPKTPSVYFFRTDWAQTQKCLIFKPSDPRFHPHKGDIVIFTFSHIGIVEKVVGTTVHTIEGNTNKAGSREGTTVERKIRQPQIIRCFIRLPILKAYDFENQFCSVPPTAKKSFSLEELLSN